VHVPSKQRARNGTDCRASAFSMHTRAQRQKEMGREQLGVDVPSGQRARRGATAEQVRSDATEAVSRQILRRYAAEEAVA
jgi:hypothetical protein